MELVDRSDAVATADSSPRDDGGAQGVEGRRAERAGLLSANAPLSFAVLLVPLVVGGVRVVLSLHQPYTHFGDVAIMESAIKDTLGGHQLLGPYSHFGWFHPGPAYFYLVSPLYWALHQNARALFLGAFLINAGCAIAVVAVIRARAGEWAARWATLVVGGLLFFTEASGISLYSPWNPALLALPILLMMVLVGSAATGSTISLVWAAIVGSFVVQTELGTVPTVFALLVVGVVLWGWVARRSGNRRPPVTGARHRAAIAGAGLLLALMWVPPLIQQTTQSPGNVRQVVSFFEHPPSAQAAGGTHTRGQALRGVAEYSTTLPLKSDAFPCCAPNQFTGPRSDYTGRFLGFGAGVLVALGVATLGWRRRDQLVGTLGTVSVVAAGSALVAATHVVGPLYEHLVWWTTAVFVPAWIGAGVLAIGWLRTRTRQRPVRTVQMTASVLLVAASAVPCVALAWSFLRDPPVGYANDPARGTAVQLVDRPVRATHVHDLRIKVADETQLPLTASIVVELQKAGVAVHLEPPASKSYGPHEQPRGADQALLVVSGPHDSAPATSTAGAGYLGTVEGMSLWMRPLPTR